MVLQSTAQLTGLLRPGLPPAPHQDCHNMKVPPIQLPTGLDRLPLPLPFSPDLLWRYPNPFLQQPPPSPLESHVKSGLPGNQRTPVVSPPFSPVSLNNNLPA